MRFRDIHEVIKNVDSIPDDEILFLDEPKDFARLGYRFRMSKEHRELIKSNNYILVEDVTSQWIYLENKEKYEKEKANEAFNQKLSLLEHHLKRFGNVISFIRSFRTGKMSKDEFLEAIKDV